jgi:hypothetical protein
MAGMIFGAILGGVAGFFVMMVVVVLTEFNEPGVWVYFVGPPVGVLVGVIAGVRAANQSARK